MAECALGSSVILGTEPQIHVSGSVASSELRIGSSVSAGVDISTHPSPCRGAGAAPAATRLLRGFDWASTCLA